jgi:hypothetical protein
MVVMPRPCESIRSIKQGVRTVRSKEVICSSCRKRIQAQCCSGVKGRLAEIEETRSARGSRYNQNFVGSSNRRSKRGRKNRSDLEPSGQEVESLDFDDGRYA